MVFLNCITCRTVFFLSGFTIYIQLNSQTVDRIHLALINVYTHINNTRVKMCNIFTAPLLVPLPVKEQFFFNFEKVVLK